MCYIIAGWQAPDCAVYLPKLQLTPDLTFEWSFDDATSPVRYVTLTTLC
jgi:hypothetical protein